MRDTYIALVQAKDTKGAPVIVAVHMNTRGESFALINKVASVYGKGIEALQKQIDNNLLYLNQDKAAEWLHAAGLRLPGANTLNGSGKKILHSGDIRNSEGKTFYAKQKDFSIEATEETYAKLLVRKLQDKFRILKDVQDNIRKAGGKIDESSYRLSPGSATRYMPART